MKLIDADALKIAISNGEYCRYCDYGHLYGCGECELYSFKDDNTQKLIDDQPVVTTNTVVRCKDCKFSGSISDVNVWCDLRRTLEDCNGYCHLGQNRGGTI